MDKRAFSKLADNDKQAEYWETLEDIKIALEGGAGIVNSTRIVYAASDVTNNPNSQTGSSSKPFGTLAQARAAAVARATANNWVVIQAIGEFEESFLAAPYISLKGQGMYATKIKPPELELIEIGVGNFWMEDLSIDTDSVNPHWLLHTRLGSTSKTVTFTIDDSSITCVSHGLSEDDQIYLTSTGDLPTNINAGTWYRVVEVDSNHFSVSLTSSSDPLGAVPITPTGSASGTHTVVKDTLMSVGTWLPNIVLNNIRVSNPNGIAIGSISAVTHKLLVDNSITGISRNISGQHSNHKIIGSKYGVKDSLGLSLNQSMPENEAFRPIFYNGEITSLSLSDGWAIRASREDPNGDISFDGGDVSWIPTLISGGVVNGGSVTDPDEGSFSPCALGCVEANAAWFKGDLISTDRVFGENATIFPVFASRLTGCTFSSQNNKVDEFFKLGNSVVSSSTFVVPNQTLAVGTLTLTSPSNPASISDGDTVSIGTNTYGASAAIIVYRFKTTPSQAYDVQKSSISNLISFQNLRAAINETGTDGVEYFAGTFAHPSAQATHIQERAIDISLNVRARVAGPGGMNIYTDKTAANLSWGRFNLEMHGMEILSNSIISNSEFESDPTDALAFETHGKIFNSTSAIGIADIGHKAPRRALLCRTRDQFAQIPLGTHSEFYPIRTVEMWVRLKAWAYSNQFADLNTEHIGLIAAPSGAREFYLTATRVSSNNAELPASRTVAGGFQGGTVSYTRQGDASDADDALDALLTDGAGPFGDHYHLVAVTLSVTTQQLIINGVNCGSTATGQLIDAAHRWVFGGFTDSTVNGQRNDYKLNGMFRGIRFSSSVRVFDPDALEKRPMVDSNTVGCWSGDEPGGSLIWADKFGGRNDATLRGPALWVPEGFTP